LDVVERGGKDFFLVWLKRAEVAARSAQVQYQKALHTNQKAPGTTSDYDLERLRLSAEIAVLEYEKGRRLLNAPTDQQYRWQISYLDSQVQKLNDEVFRKVKN
jgi:ribosomal protein L20